MKLNGRTLNFSRKYLTENKKEIVKIKQKNLFHLKIFGNEGKADEDPHS